MSTTSDVIFFALVAAAERLPPRALGLSTHAIPTETHLAECVAALERFAQTRQILAVVGQAECTEEGSGSGDIRVLRPHAAAAQATRLRNTPELFSDGTLLIYINAESSPGEAGLDGLDEVTPQDFATGYARKANLPIIGRLASPRHGVSRTIATRLEDATVPQLAQYASVARSHDREQPERGEASPCRSWALCRTTCIALDVTCR